MAPSPTITHLMGTGSLSIYNIYMWFVYEHHTSGSYSSRLKRAPYSQGVSLEWRSLVVQSQPWLFLKALAAILERAGIFLWYFLAAALCNFALLRYYFWVGTWILWCSDCTTPILFSRAKIWRCWSSTYLRNRLLRFALWGCRFRDVLAGGNRNWLATREYLRAECFWGALPVSCIFSAQS